MKKNDDLQATREDESKIEQTSSISTPRRAVAGAMVGGAVAAALSALSKRSEAAIPQVGLSAALAEVRSAVRLLQYVVIPIEAFIGKRYNAAGNLAPDPGPSGAWDLVFQAAMYEARTVQSFTLRFGPRVYLFNATLRVDAAMQIVGCGAMFTTSQSGASGTVLKFQGATQGIRFPYIDLPATVPYSSGANSLLQDLRIEGSWTPPTAPGSNHGVEINSSHVALRRVAITNFSGSGIRVYGGPSGIWVADNFDISSCFVSTVGRDGFVAEEGGADVHVGTLFNVHCTDVGRHAFHDGSSFGNLYVGCHADARRAQNPVRAEGQYVSTGATNVSTFLHCYEEQNLASSLAPSSFVVGGFLGTGSQGAGKGIGVSGEATTIYNGLGVPYANTASEAERVTFGVQGAALGLELAVPNSNPPIPDTAGALRLRYSPNAFMDGWWGFHANNATGVAAGFALNHNDTASPPGVPWLGTGFFLGFPPNAVSGALNVDERVFVENGTAPPNETAFARPIGSVVFNRVPVPGGFLGWVKTAAGWKTFGAISP